MHLTKKVWFYIARQSDVIQNFKFRNFTLSGRKKLLPVGGFYLMNPVIYSESKSIHIETTIMHYAVSTLSAYILITPFRAPRLQEPSY